MAGLSMWNEESRELLQSSSKSFGVDLSALQLSQLHQLSQRVLSHNQQLNLTRITEERDFIIKHLVDSISVLLLLPQRQPLRLLDLGTGGGFPGLVLKIAAPWIDVTLVEATKKKVSFLEETLKELSLQNVCVLWGRGETLAHQPMLRERFDVAVARAVAELRVLIEIALPFVSCNGILIAQKGPHCDSEIADSKTALSELGGQLERTVPFELPMCAGKRTVVMIRKISSSPNKYPRFPGIPQKKPL